MGTGLALRNRWETARRMLLNTPFDFDAAGGDGGGGRVFKTGGALPAPLRT